MAVLEIPIFTLISSGSKVKVKDASVINRMVMMIKMACLMIFRSGTSTRWRATL